MKSILYWMEGCPHCKKMKDTLKMLPSDYSQSIQIEKQNISQADKSRFNIQVFPTLVFLTDKGKLLNIKQGNISFDQLKMAFKHALRLEEIMKKKTALEIKGD